MQLKRSRNILTASVVDLPAAMPMGAAENAHGGKRGRMGDEAVSLGAEVLVRLVRGAASLTVSGEAGAWP